VPVGRDAHHLDPVLQAEQHGDGLGIEDLIVDDEDADGRLLLLIRMRAEGGQGVHLVKGGLKRRKLAISSR
jgi:hypothetical protein